jgi:hypothetical protein
LLKLLQMRHWQNYTVAWRCSSTGLKRPKQQTTDNRPLGEFKVHATPLLQSTSCIARAETSRHTRSSA